MLHVEEDESSLGSEEGESDLTEIMGTLSHEFRTLLDEVARCRPFPAPCYLIQERWLAAREAFHPQATPTEKEYKMTQFTQPLHEEHLELLPHIEQMKTVADAVGSTPLVALRREIDDNITFLVHQLLPHAQAEERALYPVVEKVMGMKGATATMSRDHVAIGRLTEELSDLRLHLQGEHLEALQEQTLRRILYGLFALVTVHFAKEEEIYLPLLEKHLTEDSARNLFEALEQAAREAKQAVAGAR